MHNSHIGGAELRAMMANYSSYFDDLKYFMRKWLFFLSMALEVKSHEYYHPHHYLIKIIDEAIQQMNDKQGKGEAGYEEAAEEEHAQREKEKADMAEAVCGQITLPILLKRKDKAVPAIRGTPPSTPALDANLGPSIATTPASPERNTSSLTTVKSPGTDRAVKRARTGPHRYNAGD
jgi:hypothetical protein